MLPSPATQLVPLNFKSWSWAKKGAGKLLATKWVDKKFSDLKQAIFFIMFRVPQSLFWNPIRTSFRKFFPRIFKSSFSSAVSEDFWSFRRKVEPRSTDSGSRKKSLMPDSSLLAVQSNLQRWSLVLIFVLKELWKHSPGPQRLSEYLPH